MRYVCMVLYTQTHIHTVACTRMYYYLYERRIYNIHSMVFSHLDGDNIVVNTLKIQYYYILHWIIVHCLVLFLLLSIFRCQKQISRCPIHPSASPQDPPPPLLLLMHRIGSHRVRLLRFCPTGKIEDGQESKSLAFGN